MTMPIIVRPVATNAEHDRQFYLSNIAFSDNPSPDDTAFWQEYATTLPYYHPERIRGAFRGAQMLGGYEIFEREMHMGEARLLTGCIGSVNTDPEQRMQGVASALMHDAIAYAREKHYALLYLDGIPKFYYRFGYSDVFEVTYQTLDRSAVLAQPPSIYTVRPATLEDAEGVLALYQEQQYPFTSSFTRTLEIEQHYLRHRSAENPFLLAFDTNNKVRGLLSLRKAPDRHISDELISHDWQATLALLHYHADQFAENEESPTTLRYRLPTEHRVLYEIIAHLQIPQIADRQDPNLFGAILSQTYHHRHTGWMARIIDLPTLVQSCLPEWQARWRKSLANWSGVLSFAIDGEPFSLDIEDAQLTLIDSADEQSDQFIHFSQQAFTQMLFGYRPVSWFLQDDETHLEPEVESALHILFPTGHTCIIRRDDF
jgi:GNAT superfamily N-acetyltransferase